MYLSFTMQVVVLTLVLALVVLLVQQNMNPYWIHDKTIWVIWFNFGLTWMTGLLALYLLKISKENSVSILLGVGLLRITGSLVFMFLMLWVGAENILWFVVDFFVIYLLYLLFDIYTFITNLRPHSE